LADLVDRHLAAILLGEEADGANTEEIARFKIQKEQSSSAGVRRIRAVIQ
jgi:hypothetical protein